MAHELSPDDWEAIRRSAEKHYRNAFRLCEFCVSRDLAIDHALYHFAGQLLASAIALQKVCAHALGEDVTPPEVKDPKAFCWWVKPYAGGGVVPGAGH